MAAQLGQISNKSIRPAWVRQIILRRLLPGVSLKIEELVQQVPEVSWQELFYGLGQLRRQGKIIIQERNFTLEINSTYTSYRKGPFLTR